MSNSPAVNRRQLLALAGETLQNNIPYLPSNQVLALLQTANGQHLEERGEKILFGKIIRRHHGRILTT